MKRWALNTAGGLALALFLGVTALWASSYRYGERYGWWNADTDCLHCIWSAAGGLQVAKIENIPDAKPVAEFTGWQRWADPVRWSDPRAPVYKELAGFRYASGDFPGSWGSPYWIFSIPFWSVAVLTGLPSAWYIATLLRRRTQRRRIHQGRCRACGYDLRASPTQCPECGAAAPNPTAIAATSSGAGNGVE